jgi:hypothetical protein
MRRETAAEEPGVIRMRQPVRRAGTHRSHDHRRAQGYVSNGTRFGLGVVVLLLIMAIGAVSASAGARSMTRSEASAVLERPVGTAVPSGEAGAPGRLVPFGPDLVPDAVRAPGVAVGSTIFYDGFEGAPQWDQVLGDPTWAGTTYRSAAGQWSAYCAGSSINPPGPYYNNMSAWLVAGPFNLSNVTAATFQYMLNYATESDRDYVQAMVSLNGQNFYGYGYSGNSQGWKDNSIDLTNVPTLGDVCGYSQVWIAFMFESDSSIAYEGAYVDEVLVSGSAGGGASSLSLDASPLIVPYRGTVTLDGELRSVSSGALLPGQDIGWYWSQNDNIPRDWTFGATASSSTGFYSLPIGPIERRTYFVLEFAGDSQYDASESNFIKVMPRAKLTPPAIPSRVRAFMRITSWGTLKPRHAAGMGSHTKVYWQRFTGGRWRSVVSLYAQSYRNTPSETKYGVTLMYAPGRWRVQAVHKDIDHAATASAWRYFTAR